MFTSNFYSQTHKASYEGHTSEKNENADHAGLHKAWTIIVERFLALFLIFMVSFLLFSVNPASAHNQNTSGSISVKDEAPLSPVAKYGQLSVQGRYLMGEHGDTVVLRGQSYGWSQWWPQYWNEDVVQWVTDDWKIDVIRGAVGAPAFVEYNDDPQIHYDLMHSVVQAAIANGIYVIIDWHAHEIYTEEAIEFFTEFAQTYTGHPNIIYEIFNEPTNQPWADIKAYSVAVIEAIRAHDPDNIILIGTPHWCQDIHVAANDPIVGFDNLMYVLHFYADSHQQWLRNRLINVSEQGLPIFVSEMSGMSYTGSGPINYHQWQLWFNLLEELKISWVNYSLTDAAGQSCSVLLPGASVTGGWTIDEFDLLDPGQLNESGIYIRNKLRRIHGVMLPVFPMPGIVRGVDFVGMHGVIVVGNDAESLYRGEGYGISAGGINDGDWMEYLVDFTEGHYTFHFNISSTKTGNLQILAGDNLLAEVAIPNTQGTFTIVSTEEDIFMPEGQYTVRIAAPTGGWRLHWWYGDDGTPVDATGINITPGSTRIFIGQGFLFQADVRPFNASNKAVEWVSSAPEVASVAPNGLVTGISHGSAQIYATTVDGGFTDSATVWVLGAFILPGIVQAEDYYDMHGIQTEPSTEGGLNVGYIMPGDWMDYYVNPQKDTTYLISFRVASNTSGGTLQLRSGSEVLTQANIPVTGGWQNWVTVTAVTNLMAGPQILRIHSLTSGWNIAWWQAGYTDFYDPTNISLYNKNEWVIYPNPADRDGFFVYNTSNNQYNHIGIKVVNSLGEEVLAFRSENNPVWVERYLIRGSGIFFIEIRSGDRRTVKRISLL